MSHPPEPFIRPEEVGAWRAAMAVVALAVTAVGFYQIYSVQAVVGGDAYNFLIGASRGLGTLLGGITILLLRPSRQR